MIPRKPATRPSLPNDIGFRPATDALPNAPAQTLEQRLAEIQAFLLYEAGHAALTAHFPISSVPTLDRQLTERTWMYNFKLFNHF